MVLLKGTEKSILRQYICTVFYRWAVPAWRLHQIKIKLSAKLLLQYLRNVTVHNQEVVPQYLLQLLLCGLRPLFLLRQITVQRLHLLELLLVHLGEIGGFPAQVSELTALNVCRFCAYWLHYIHQKEAGIRFEIWRFQPNIKLFQNYLLTGTSVFAVSDRFARILITFPDADPQQALFQMIWIHDVLIRIRIHGCVSLYYGSGSCSFHLWLSRCQQKKSFFF
jgi:hypothetical protein